jgi:hypothetical protein
MREITTDERELIFVGRELPFSVYSSDRNLLLAKGQVIPNEFVRQGLLRSGRYRSEHLEPTRSGDTGSSTLLRQLSIPYHKLFVDYSQVGKRTHGGFRLLTAAGGEGITDVIGVSQQGALIMTAALTADGSEVPLAHGQELTLRVFYAEAVLRFKAVVVGLAREPFAHFYLDSPRELELNNVRKAPRAPVCIPASRSGEAQLLATDLSVGGARVAADAKVKLPKGRVVALQFKLAMLGEEVQESIEAEVLNVYGRSDANHPEIDFYGVRFRTSSPMQTLRLHAFVQEQLYRDLDRVRQVLFAVPQKSAATPTG